VTALRRLLDEALGAGTPWLLGGLVATATLIAFVAPGDRKRLRGVTILTALHLVTIVAAALLALYAAPAAARATRLVAYVFEVLAVVGREGRPAFGGGLRRRRAPGRRILQDVIMAGAALVASFIVASNAGFNLSGLIATSAVLTAVIGFSMQDTLGNVIGGLSLQLDRSLTVGAWVKVGDVSGKIKEIRWRYTALMTRNGEVVLMPNGVLMKSQVVLLGEGLQPGRWRRWVWFNVDFRYQPSDVIEAVESALRAAPIARVADDPPPNCVCMEIGESQCRYAVRYWLTDPQVDDPTDSIVRTRVYFALARAKIRLSMPAHAIFLTQEDGTRELEKAGEAHARQCAALRKVDVLRSLDDATVDELARELRYAPFTNGEILTRQGAEAHWLYLIVDGRVSVRVRDEAGTEVEVTQLGPGNFFGEMSLMTGEPRAATVVALSDVECYRLSAESFKRVIQASPEQAEDFAEVLAQRRTMLDAARQGLDETGRARRAATHKEDLLDKIKSFLGV